MKLTILNAHPVLREKAPQFLATATFLFAGYGIGNIVATVSKAVF